MLTTYFTRQTTRAQYYAGPAGPYLDAFTQWLAQRGYRQESIRSHCQQLFRPIGQHSVRWLGAQRFFTFLQTQQLLPLVAAAPDSVPPALLSAFEQWMHVHRGVLPQTLQNYRRHLLALLTELGECPEQFDAARLRTFLLASGPRRSVAWVKTRAIAVRMFLRYLSAHGCCQPDLEAALPLLLSGAYPPCLATSRPRMWNV